MRKYVFLPICVIAITQIYAQEILDNQSEATVLDPVEVVGFQFSSEGLSSPINSTFINSEEISESATTSLPELLSQKTTVRALTYSGNPNDASLSMRGFGENSQLRVAVIVDGVRINRADMATIPWLSIPINNVGSVELLRGANSARYGNNAVAGVLSIKTKDVEKSDTLRISGMYGSFNTYSANLHGSISANDYFASVNVHRYYTDGYRDFSKSWSNNYSGSIGYFISEYDKLTFDFGYSDMYSEYANPLSRQEMLDDPRKATSATTIYDSESFNASGHFEHISSASKAFANISFITYDRIISKEHTNDQYTLSFSSEIEFEIQEDLRTYFGIEAQFADISVEKNLNTEFANSKLSYKEQDASIERLNLGVWAGAMYDIKEDLTLDACLRFDAAKTSVNYIERAHRLAFVKPWYEIYTDNANSYNDNVWQKGIAASLSLNYKIDEKSSVYAKFDQLFRYPSTDEIALYQGMGIIAEVIKFNPDLKPEIGQNFEIGFKYLGKNLTINSSLYALFLHNEIMYFPTTTTNGKTVNDNAPDTLRLGADLFLEYDVGWGGFYTGASMIDARFVAGKYDGNDIPFIPHFNGFAGIFIKPHERVKFTMQTNYSSNQYPMSDLENSWQKVPSWVTLDLRLNVKLCDYANAYFAVDNVLDEHYTLAAVFGNYYPAMGRMFKVGLNLKF